MVVFMDLDHLVTLVFFFVAIIQSWLEMPCRMLLSVIETIKILFIIWCT